MRSLASLDDDLTLLVYFELSLVDIYSVRQVCRSLCDVTRAKILWINLLGRISENKGTLMPFRLKKYDLLDAVALESLVRRLSRLSYKWETGNLSPVDVWRIYLPQRITWLRLVSGTWLFVASSDDHCSKISCWDLSLVRQGNKEPLAEAYLPGQVKTGKLEVQGSQIVLALGLGAESLSVHIITVRQRSGRYVFVELCHIEDSSHVLMLCGDFVGCALRHEAAVPHLINWKDNLIHEILPPPGGLDIPGRRSVPHLMTIWSNHLVILRMNSLEIYTVPSKTRNSVFIKLLKTPPIWEAVVCHSPPLPVPCVPSLHLVVISSAGVELCVVEHDILTGLNNASLCSDFSLAQLPLNGRDPWYHLCVGETGRRVLWVSQNEKAFSVDPHIVYANVPPLAADTEMARVCWNDAKPDKTALWALPVIDFNDALGLTVVGNCFGELAIYDHAGNYPESRGLFAVDFIDQPDSLPPALPNTSIPLVRDFTVV
ncbi:hypothetical protein B0H13DRAFT_2398674 [Mycena leptocephala]|nr:hypothetical protein B0H13DRAFT_2398674 [Mycena leptocephala]